MAPEQWRGQATTTAADVWALGVLLFEACAGRRPFQASRAQPRQRRLAELAQQVAACEPAPSLAAAAPVPAAFAALVERCLEKDAGARPAAPEVVEALAALVAPQPAAPQPSTAPPPAPAPARARTWAIGALAALSLSAGGAGALVILRADSEARVHSTPAAQPARERLTATPRLEGDSAAEPPVTPQPSGAPAPSDAKGARPAPAPAPSQAKSAAPWDPLSYR
jgi:serine/threonine protein kinase